MRADLGDGLTMNDYLLMLTDSSGFEHHLLHLARISNEATFFTPLHAPVDFIKIVVVEEEEEEEREKEEEEYLVVNWY